MKRLMLVWISAALAMLLQQAPAKAQEDMRVEQVLFPAGTTGTTVEGRITEPRANKLPTVLGPVAGTYKDQTSLLQYGR